MSDFYGALISTSFRVRDSAAFLADPAIVYLREMVAHPLYNGFFEEDDQHPGYFAFGWNDQYPDPLIKRPATKADPPETVNDCQEVEYDLLEVIQRHIVPGDVCRVQVSGQEKLIYLGGGLWWVTSRGIVDFDGHTHWDAKLTEAEFAKEVGDFHSQVGALLAGGGE